MEEKLMERLTSDEILRLKSLQIVFDNMDEFNIDDSDEIVEMAQKFYTFLKGHNTL